METSVYTAKMSLNWGDIDNIKKKYLNTVGTTITSFFFIFPRKQKEYWKEINLPMYIPPVSPVVAHKLPKNNHGCIALIYRFSQA